MHVCMHVRVYYTNIHLYIYMYVLGETLPLIDGGGRPGLDHCYVVDGYISTDNLASSGSKGRNYTSSCMYVCL